METHSLIVTLFVALGAAFFGAALAVRLRQSVILGYILAGIAIGPFTPGPVGDVAGVQSLADVGIIFLMFAIGVQLSLRELLHAGRVAALGSLAQVLATIGLGAAVGFGLGWRPLEGVFFGAVLSICSSAVLTKLLGERGEMDSAHGRLTVGWSAYQDLFTVVLVVVLSALSTGSEHLVVDLVVASAKAGLFLALAIPLGSVVLPRLLDRVAALHNREVFLLAIMGIALGTAYGSTMFGLSLALGAFIAGVVVSESELSHQILGEITPLRDIFAGLFFVSVGMLVDPLFVAANLPLVLLTVALIVVGKGVLTAGILALSRLPLRSAVLGGVLLAQAGEFSFLLARLGVDLGVLSPGTFSLILAAAVVSIILAPMLFNVADPLLLRIEARWPRSRWSTHPDLDDTAPQRPRGHAVICGYGRVGRVVGTALERRGFRFVVIEQDLQAVRDLRARGVTALRGSAANVVLLERANIRDACVLVVAIPDPIAVRLIVDHARVVNRRLDIVVRTHSAPELALLQERGVSEAVMGELELALELTRHTLHRFGVSSPEIQVIVRGLRDEVTTRRTFEEWEIPS